MLGIKFNCADGISIEEAQDLYELTGTGTVVTDGAFIQFEHKKGSDSWR